MLVQTTKFMKELENFTKNIFDVYKSINVKKRKIDFGEKQIQKMAKKAYIILQI